MTSQSHSILGFLISLLLFTLLMVFPFHAGNCSQVKLAWDPNTESDLAGYAIYYGMQSGNYQWKIDVGDITTYTLTGLKPGITYYIAATAYNIEGLESGFSNEVDYKVSPNMPWLMLLLN
ncbi:MAG: fibronectin type III domain-containing protein [Thermodesulfobacteriota bacterium]